MSGGTGPAPGHAVRILSVAAPPAWWHRPTELAAAITAVPADVVCVHGGPRGLRWRARSAALARRSGLVIASGSDASGGCYVLCSLGVDELPRTQLTLDNKSRRSPRAAANLRLAGLRLQVQVVDGADRRVLVSPADPLTGTGRIHPAAPELRQVPGTRIWVATSLTAVAGPAGDAQLTLVRAR